MSALYLILVAIACGSAHADAPAEERSGWHVRAGVNAPSFTVASGIGASAAAGYDVTQHFAVEAAWDHSAWSVPLTLGGWGDGASNFLGVGGRARWHWGRVTPYLTLRVGVRSHHYGPRGVATPAAIGFGAGAEPEELPAT